MNVLTGAINDILANVTASITSAQSVNGVYNAWGQSSAAITEMRNSVVAFLISTPSPSQADKTRAVDGLIVAEAMIVRSVYDALTAIDRGSASATAIDRSSASAFLTSFQSNTQYLLGELATAAKSDDRVIADAAASLYVYLSGNNLPSRSRSSGLSSSSATQPGLSSLSSGGTAEQPPLPDDAAVVSIEPGQMEADLRNQIDEAKQLLRQAGVEPDNQGINENDEDYLKSLERQLDEQQPDVVPSGSAARSSSDPITQPPILSGGRRRLRGQGAEINVIAQGIVEF